MYWLLLFFVPNLQLDSSIRETSSCVECNTCILKDWHFFDAKLTRKASTFIVRMHCKGNGVNAQYRMRFRWRLCEVKSPRFDCLFNDKQSDNKWYSVF